MDSARNPHNIGTIDSAQVATSARRIGITQGTKLHKSHYPKDYFMDSSSMKFGNIFEYMIPPCLPWHWLYHSGRVKKFHSATDPEFYDIVR